MGQIHFLPPPSPASPPSPPCAATHIQMCFIMFSAKARMVHHEGGVRGSGWRRGEGQTSIFAGDLLFILCALCLCFSCISQRGCRRLKVLLTNSEGKSLEWTRFVVLSKHDGLIWSSPFINQKEGSEVTLKSILILFTHWEQIRQVENVPDLNVDLLD